jgi:hypothetical protein
VLQAKSSLGPGEPDRDTPKGAYADRVHLAKKEFKVSHISVGGSD